MVKKAVAAIKADGTEKAVKDMYCETVAPTTVCAGVYRPE